MNDEQFQQYLKRAIDRLEAELAWGPATILAPILAVIVAFIGLRLGWW